VFEQYSNLARTAVMFARLEAGRMGAKEIDSEHILLGIVRVDPAMVFAVAPELTLDAARDRAAGWQAPTASVPTSVGMPVSDEATRILDRAGSLAKDRKDAFLRTEHLLLALALEPSHGCDILTEAGAEFHQGEQLVGDRLGAGQQDKRDWSEEDLSELFG
jgi:ATP-dependent Clp protease ATP-binding subunit ClpB